MKRYAYPNLADVPMSAVMHALADPGRLEIVRQLLQQVGGECACGEFCESLSKATVSHHMRVLRAAGLIQHRAEGAKSITFLRTKEVEKRFPGLWKLVGRKGGKI